MGWTKNATLEFAVSSFSAVRSEDGAVPRK